MQNIGIITYHSAYNYGSALQALATQEAIRKVTSCNVSILNYRTSEQKRVYALYRKMHGPKIFLEDCFLLPIHAKRKKHNERFESFFKKYMNLTSTIFTPDQAIEMMTSFDVMISGSDQIWNKYSLELANVPWDDMRPYLLCGFNGKKISYASSIGNMTDDEIIRIKEDIEKFDSVSCRESVSAERLRKLTMCKPKEVLDPTFLLDKDEWIHLLGLKETTEKYILFYGLGGLGYLHNILKTLKPYAKKRGLKLKVVMPYAYLPFQGSEVEFCADAGPKELLELIMNASMVVTNSYHGTILSVNFGKELYSICTPGGSEFRKTEILKKVGLSERVIESVNTIADKDGKAIDYNGVANKLYWLRQDSLTYIQNALNL